jgi:hypothetical protein
MAQCLSKLAGNLNSDIFSAQPSKSARMRYFRSTAGDAYLIITYHIIKGANSDANATAMMMM